MVTEEKITHCAEILGCSADSLREFPDNIQEKLCTCMEIYDVTDSNSAKQQYEELERIWRTGSIILGMIEISENIGVSQTKLAALSENDKLNLMYEYAIGADKETLMRMIER